MRPDSGLNRADLPAIEADHASGRRTTVSSPRVVGPKSNRASQIPANDDGEEAAANKNRVRPNAGKYDAFTCPG
jgi:hypothetical protein